MADAPCRGRLQPGPGQGVLDLALVGAVEDRVIARMPRRWAAQPRCVSRIWPTFMREGTPMGFRMMSTGVPSGRKGMSSTGTTMEMTPLLPWRPAILSPSLILRFWAIETRTISFTPAGRSFRGSRGRRCGCR